ncbi:ATP synthase F1 subunit delta [Flaviaesturariibacter aridisoli]|uniref:ATP synthase subunit delta n=1 Tax=Flaviaesturariibacter aridisoli TaxID=2545761 RepID=A0A4R4E6S2_9BACT|nr:ATP synthase F1 subunit delta [Flaviaesturariibacter aridisoli]TCZ74757.1 ATP synthase F1 subunit delta [Flaviaesturariibacter aridisoli]
MPNPRLAGRYAKSLLDLAVERGQLEAVYADMQYLRELLRQSRDLAVMLKSPVVSADKKQTVLNAVVGNNVSELTMAFARLLVGKHREGELVEIIPAFLQQYRQHKGIHTVKLTTAAPISEETKNRIMAQVKSSGHLDLIELETSVNPDLIGGFVLQTGDKLVDASVAYELQEIGRQFEKNDYLYKIV